MCSRKARNINRLFTQIKECWNQQRALSALSVTQVTTPQRLPWYCRSHTRKIMSPSPTSKVLTSSFHTSNHDYQQVSLQGSHSHSVSLQEDGLVLQYGEYNLHLLYVWLRDHCRCNVCYNHATNQKNVDNYQISPDIKPVEVSFDGTIMTLMWPDKHMTCYNINWLLENSYHQNHQDRISKLLWNKDIFSSQTAPIVPYDEFMLSEEGLKKHLCNLLKYGVSIVTKAPSTHEGTEKVAERVCALQETFFGKSWSFTSDLTHADTAYTKLALGAHTDTTYFMSPCGIQVFHVLEHDGAGGETLLVDGFYAAEKLREANPEAFNFLIKAVVAHEFFEEENKARSLGTVLSVHPTTDQLLNIRFNPYDRSPLFTLPPSEVQMFYDSYAELTKEIKMKENEFWIKLKPDMVLFVDNWRVMHGRASFTGYRQVSGCYLTRDDWISQARVHGLLNL